MVLRAGGLTGLMNQPSAQVIDGSLKIESTSNTAGSYLTRTPISDGDRKCWTWSGWVRRERYGTEDGIFVSSDSGGNSDYTALYFNTADELKTTSYQSSSLRWRVTTNAVFRDTGWYHIILAVDLRQSTNSNKVKLYVNGSQITSFRQEEYPSTDFETRINSTNEHSIGRASLYDRWYSDFRMSQVYFIDGLQLGPRFFGFNDPLTGTWRPRKLREGDITVNDGTVWSGGIPGNTLSNYPATNAFDGNLSTFVYADVSTTMTWTAPTPVSGKKIEVYAYAGGTHPILNVNGQSTGAVVGGTTQHNVWVDVTHLCPGGNLETIQAFGQNISGTDRQSGFAAVRVDGEILIDRKVFNSKNPNNGTTWSDSLTTNAGDNFDGSGAKTKAFDGNGSNKAYTANNSNGTTQGTSYLEMVFPTAISGRLRVKCDNGNTVRNTTGGGDVLLATQGTGSDNQFVDCGTVSGLTNLRVLMSGGSRPAISIIELDGHVFIDGAPNNSFYLPMDGNSSVGEDKSGNTSINTGIVWSSYGDDTNINSSYPWSKAFDGQATGNFGQGAGATDGAGWARWTPGVTLTVSTKLRINTDNGSTSAVKVKFSGSSEQHLTSLTDGWNDVSGTGTLEYIEIYNQGTTWSYLTAVEIDNMILVDGANGNSWTLANFGGSVELDKATGALPILNTTQGGTRATVGVRTDAYASNLVLALPLVGRANDVSNQINSGTTAKTVTVNNNATAISRGNFYGGSFDFDGSGDRLVLSNYGSDFTFDGDFTMECWLFIDDSATVSHPNGDRQIAGVWTGSNNDWLISYSGTGDHNIFLFQLYTGGSVVVASSGVNMSTYVNKWVHLAVVRNSGYIQCYVDGVAKGTPLSNSATFGQTSNVAVGGRVGGDSHTVAGSIQDFRIYKGVAKYTSDFVVSSPSPDVLPDTPSGVSGGSKLTKITDGAVSFEGTAKSKLRVNDSSDFTFGTNDFCIEYFYYNNSLDGTYNIIFDNIDSNRSGIQLSMFTSNHYSIEVGDGASNWIWKTTGDYPATQQQWVHFALTRQGSTFRAFENGVLLATQTSSTAVGNPRAAAIGGYSADDTTNYGFNGFISNFRIVNGSPVYTSNFTPPTRALTNITNTKLLCCQSNKSSAIAAVSPNISGSINDGTAWSSIVTGPTRHQDRVSNAFDGTTSGPGAIPAYPGTLNFAPGLSSISSVKIYGYYAGSGVTLHVNGSQQSPSSGAFTLTISTSTLDSVVWTAIDGFNYIRIDAIEVDSTVLIDPVVAIDDSNADATNFNPFITNINTVRGQESGYATLNPLDTNFGSNLKDGNLQAVGSSNWSAGHARGNIALTSGKWFWESTYSAGSSTLQFGFANSSASLSETYGSVPANSWTYYFPNSQILYPSGGVSTYFTAGASLGDTIGCALDMDNGTWQFFKNGVGGTVYTLADTDSGSTESITELYPWVGSYNGTQDINFGQKPFKFPPPDGFQPLNSANVRPVKVIPRPDHYVGVAKYTGNGGTQSINFLNTDPDFVWIKNRDESVSHFLYDSVRGANNYLRSDGNFEEDAGSSNELSFIQKGFTVNGAGGGVNKNTIDFVSWSWKAGGNKNTFNVDDVGYASASDVNMSVGALNSVGLNQTQNWTSKVTWAAGGWNGDGTAPFDNDGTNYDYSSETRGNNGRATLDISSLTGSRVITVISEQTEVTVNHDGGSTTFTPPNTNRIIHTFDPVMNPTSIEFIGLNSGSYMVLIGVYVDGARLVNSGVSATNVPSNAATGCSVGTKQGFSIVKFNSGSAGIKTIPHGLSETPTFAMIKTTGTTSDWSVYHKSLGQYLNNYLVLNSTAANASATNIWGDSPPTSSYFGIKSGTTTATSQDCIAYLWHDVPGLQKFGTYEGSGVAGNYVHLGFRPALIWIKNIDSTSIQNWGIIDSNRSFANVGNHTLAANLNNPESYYGDGSSVFGANNKIDLLSDGFTLRETSGFGNTSGITFLYCAWAEAPSFNLYGGQSNAR